MNAMIYSISSVFVSSSTVARAAIDERGGSKGVGAYVCVYLCMYIGYIYVDERPSFSCQNILSLNACIDPGRPATYIHMQSCDVEAEPLTQYLRPLSWPQPPVPFSERERYRGREYGKQNTEYSRAKLQRVTYPSY